MWYRQPCFIINAQAAMESAQSAILLAARCWLLGRGIGGLVLELSTSPPSYIPSAPGGLGGDLSWELDYWGLDGSWIAARSKC